MQDWQQIIIDVIGWIYFFAWSFSFYGQIYENYRCKSVAGMNFDFVAMNLTGFTFYSIYCSYGYFIDSSQTGLVELNDLLFAYHAIFATLLTLTQVIIYPKGNNKIHIPTIIYLLALWTFVIVYGTLTEKVEAFKPDPDTGLISMMGYFKLSISFLKYLPQLYWNYQRKSTVGWSIANIILDLTGGLFSFGQMGLQAIFGQDVKINVVKFALGIMVVIYDLLFIVQHYFLYPQSGILGVYHKYKEEAPHSMLTTENINDKLDRKSSSSSESSHSSHEHAHSHQHDEEDNHQHDHQHQETEQIRESQNNENKAQSPKQVVENEVQKQQIKSKKSKKSNKSNKSNKSGERPKVSA